MKTRKTLSKRKLLERSVEEYREKSSENVDSYIPIEAESQDMQTQLLPRVLMYVLSLNVFW